MIMAFFNCKQLRLLLTLLIGLTSLLGYRAISHASDPPFLEAAPSNNPLPVNQAFTFHSEAAANNTLLLSWDIKPGYYLYKDQLQVSIQTSGSPEYQELSLNTPAGKMKDDEEFGLVEVFEEYLELEATLPDHPAFEVKIEYQGCDGIRGLCYPPQKRFLSWPQKNQSKEGAIESLSIPLSQNSSGFTTTNSASTAVESTNQSTLSQSGFNLKSRNLWIVLLVCFGMGALIGLTPCIYPMVPILSSIIIGNQKPKTEQDVPSSSAKQGLLLSLAYVHGMALPYIAMGTLAAWLGEAINLTTYLQQPVFIIFTAVLFVLLALAMFDFYQLTLPASWNNKLNNYSGNASANTLPARARNAFVIGALASFVVSPCTTAPLVGALAWATSCGNPALAALGFYLLSLGIGLPLILLGAGGGKLLPKSSGWMNHIKYVLGLMLLAVSIDLFSRVLDAHLLLYLWGLLCVFAGLLLGPQELAPEANTARRAIKQAVATVLILFGSLQIIGGSMKHESALFPLYHPATNPSAHFPPFEPTLDKQSANLPNKPSKITVTSMAGLTEAIARSNPLSVIKFTAKWCSSCRKMEKTVFKNPEVLAALQGSTLISADVTKNNADAKAMMAKYNIVGPPALIFIHNGDLVSSSGLFGEIDSATFIHQLYEAQAKTN